MALKVAVDVGGTFTDICVMNEETGDISVDRHLDEQIAAERADEEDMLAAGRPTE